MTPNLLSSLKKLGLEKSLVLSIIQQLHDHGRAEICLPNKDLPQPFLRGKKHHLGDGFLVRILASSPNHDGYTSIEIIDKTF